jgi:hypothetical protein
LVIVDTDVLLLAFAFHRDDRQAINREFLRRVQAFEPATTIYNLMELLGQLSFNLSPERLDAWPEWLVEAYGLDIIQPPTGTDEKASAFFHTQIVNRPFAKMRRHRMAFLDALILDLSEQIPNVSALVTWNARHFKDKSNIGVVTPTEFLTTIK